MARFLITMLPANDLGLPTRMVPIARALADRGHEVAVFNPAPAPRRLIAEAGLINLPMPARPMPGPAVDLTMIAEGWDVKHFFAGFYSSEDYVRDATAFYVDLIRDYAPGDTYIRQGDYSKAQEELDRAVLLEPNSPVPFILLGKVLLKQQDPVMAKTYLDKALAMDPRNI